jgi:ABC-type dipeptide/oligopeptide/nickel transport system permease subunit
MPILSKEKRIVYLRKIQGFWEDFHRNRIGFAGLIILILYAIVGVFANYIAPYDPSHPPLVAGAKGVAAPFAMPEWMAIFPQYRDLPRTILRTTKDMTIVQNASGVAISTDNERFIFNYTSDGSLEEKTVMLGAEINYQYTPPPPEFWFEYIFDANINPKYGVTVTAEILVKSEIEDPFWEEYFINSTLVSLSKKTLTMSFSTVTLSGSSQGHDTRKYLFYPKETSPDKYLSMDPTNYIFAQKQKYQILFNLTFRPNPRYANQTATVHLKSGGFETMGSLHGILGTQLYREDVFSELVYGVRISLIIGILAAVISTTLGILIGVVAGYAGGIVDEALMRIIDILLCLPVLPLLIILIYYYKPNIFFIVLLIAIFGWQGLSRIVRARVLSIREMPFIESARAAGASNSYILIHHLIPNVIPVAMAALILSVPGAILTEAALSFIGFGDPNWATWGRMLNDANGSGAFTRLAWWYAVPPGLAMTILCLGFVFIGHAVDEIVNPRLRRRR